MADMDTCCLIGRGRVYIGEYICPEPGQTNDAPKRFIGNTENLQLDISQTTQTQTDFTVSNGTDCSVTFIDEVTLQLDVRCFNPENIALAFYGEGSAMLAQPAFSEDLAVPSAVDGAYIALSQLPDTSATPFVLTDTVGTVLVEGVDYVVRNSGIELLPGNSVAPGSTLTATYDTQGCTITELITDSQREVTLCFDGFNCVDNRPFSVTLYRVRLNPVASLGFISDDFQTLTLTGTVNRDEAVQSGTAFSQFGIIKQAS